MQDQVDQMSATGVRTTTINSMQTAAERDATIRALSAGEIDLLYLSPEQLEVVGACCELQLGRQLLVACAEGDQAAMCDRGWTRM